MSLAVLLGAAVVGTGSWAQEAHTAEAAECTLNKHAYTCNWTAFKAALANAHTVAVRTGRTDKSAGFHLGKLVTSMGKTVAASEAESDLTFAVLQAPLEGVNIGPADVDLGELRVFRSAGQGQPEKLIWVETMRGQPDKPWGSTVRALIDQFQARLAK